MGTGQQPTRVRFVVLALLGLAPACAYSTRVISAFNTTLAEEFGISNQEVGGVIAGFALGYFVFQVPGGIFANVFGVRLVLPLLGLAWSLSAVWGSFARSADELFYSRVLLGIAQAGLVPCCASVVAEWFPLKRRGVVSSVMSGSMQAGAIVATSLSARLLETAGWRNLLLSYALFGVAWSALFYVMFRNRPEQHPDTNEAERALIQEGRRATNSEQARALSKGEDRPYLRVLLILSLFGYFLQALFRAYGYEFYTSWFPAYLEKAFGVERSQAGELAAWPLVAYFSGSMLGGLLLDWVLIVTGSRWLSRCGLAVAVMTASAGCFTLATLCDEPHYVVAVLTLGCVFASIAGPANWAAGMDLGGRHTAVVFGTMNMIGNVGSFLCPQHVGRLFDHIEATSASWHLVLWLFVGIHLAAALSWLIVVPTEPRT